MPREYDFKAFDGKSVHVYVWDEVSKPLGMVQICHGMAEHALRYDRFARYLNENGFIVFADDHRGHGKTDAEHLGYSDGDIFIPVYRWCFWDTATALSSRRRTL